MPRSLEERFWAKVAVGGPDDCWLWRGATSGTPGRQARYGHVTVNKRKVGAHRLAYELAVGPIPAGLTIDHLCRVTLCCNPAHLEPVTHAVNNQRRPDRSVTHCPQGHPYSGPNLYRHRGRRYCRSCMSARAREWRHRRAQIQSL